LQPLCKKALMQGVLLLEFLSWKYWSLDQFFYWKFWSPGPIFSAKFSPPLKISVLIFLVLWINVFTESFVLPSTDHYKTTSYNSSGFIMTWCEFSLPIFSHNLLCIKHVAKQFLSFYLPVKSAKFTLPSSIVLWTVCLMLILIAKHT